MTDFPALPQLEIRHFALGNSVVPSIPEIIGRAIMSASRAKERAAMGSEWQPIDSAPKDGTRILVFEGAGSPVCGKVYVGFWYEGDEQASLPYSDKCWSDTADPSYERSPTHWMPLPEPPGS